MKNAVWFAHATCIFISIYPCVLTFAMEMKSINHKSHWNNDLVSYGEWKIMSDFNMSNGKTCFDKKYMVSDLNMSYLKVSVFFFFFFSFPLLGFTLVIKLRSFDLILKVLQIFWYFFIKKKLELDLNTSHGKMSGFVSFPFFGFTLVMKLRNFDFESHGIIFIFFDKEILVSDLNISHEKMSDFASFSLFGFTLAIKLRNSEFKIHWNILTYLGKKKILCQIWICPMEKCLILFHFHCLGSL